MSVELQIIRPGDTTKPAPYTILFVANPVLEVPWNSGTFIADPMPSNKVDFDAAVGYAVDCFLGAVPNQAENLMGDSRIAPNIRIVSLRVTGLPATDANALVGESVLGRLLAPRRDQMVAFAAEHDLLVDVVIAVSESAKYMRASAYGTTDDPTRPGTPFSIDGLNRMHWHFAQIPGTIALHKTSRSLTPLHEFSHAASSYSSGFITDLYVDNATAQLNCKVGRPIPAGFAIYNGASFNSDPLRDGLGYQASWNSYHCELVNASAPALMDNYPASTNPLACRHDRITAAYLTDRLIAKIGR